MRVSVRRQCQGYISHATRVKGRARPTSDVGKEVMTMVLEQLQTTQQDVVKVDRLYAPQFGLVLFVDLRSVNRRQLCERRSDE